MFHSAAIADAQINSPFLGIRVLTTDTPAPKKPAKPTPAPKVSPTPEENTPTPTQEDTPSPPPDPGQETNNPDNAPIVLPTPTDVPLFGGYLDTPTPTPEPPVQEGIRKIYSAYPFKVLQFITPNNLYNDGPKTIIFSIALFFLST